MEGEYAAILRRQTEAFNAGDLEASFEHLDPDIEWVVAREHPAARTLRGLDELREYRADWEQMMPGLSFEVLEVVESEGAALGLCRIRGTGAASGAEVGIEIGFLARFRDGRIVRMEEYLNPAEARAALAAS